MKNFICGILVTIAIALGFAAALNSCVAKKNTAVNETQAELEALVLTENEIDFWMRVYIVTESKSGMSRPVQAANKAILELRKVTGGME